MKTVGKYLILKVIYDKFSFFFLKLRLLNGHGVFVRNRNVTVATIKVQTGHHNSNICATKRKYNLRN